MKVNSQIFLNMKINKKYFHGLEHEKTMNYELLYELRSLEYRKRSFIGNTCVLKSANLKVMSGIFLQFTKRNSLKMKLGSIVEYYIRIFLN